MKQEVVVITGATAGVGRATAHKFAKQGCLIALLARGKERLENTKKEVEKFGGKAICISTDVSKPEEVKRAAGMVEEKFGEIDIWINNAMTAVFNEFHKIEPNDYKRVTDVVYHGQVIGTQEALKRMLPRNRGTIVLIGSALAFRGIPLQSAYCGAKHAIEGMFESLRAELFHNKSKVHLTMVQLPAVNTPQFNWVKNGLRYKAQPVPPIYQPEVVADGIFWAAHHKRRQVYIGFPTVKAIWANKFFPALVDRFLGKKGYQSQMRGELENKERANNLWTPVAGDFGTHGDFDASSRTSSFELEFVKYKYGVLLLVLFIGVFILLL